MDFTTLAKKRILENLRRLSATQYSSGGVYLAQIQESGTFHLNVMFSENEVIMAISSDEFSGSRYLQDNYIILKNLLEGQGLTVFTSIHDWRKKLAS